MLPHRLHGSPCLTLTSERVETGTYGERGYQSTSSAILEYLCFRGGSRTCQRQRFESHILKLNSAQRCLQLCGRTLTECSARLCGYGHVDGRGISDLSCSGLPRVLCAFVHTCINIHAVSSILALTPPMLPWSLIPVTMPPFKMSCACMFWLDGPYCFFNVLMSK